MGFPVILNYLVLAMFLPHTLDIRVLEFYRNRMYRFARMEQRRNYMAAIMQDAIGVVLKFDGSPMRLYMATYDRAHQNKKIYVTHNAFPNQGFESIILRSPRNGCW